MAKRRYTDEQRASALAALTANAGNVNRTATQIGLPETTLRQWAKGERHPEAAKMSEEKREPLASKLEELAYQLAGAIPGKIEDARLSHVAIAMGICIEKMRLLRGEPTSINSDGISDAERADRVAALLELARARRTGPPTNGVHPAPVVALPGPADSRLPRDG